MYSCKGFTLFELLVVLFVVSLFMVIAIPSLSVLSDSRIKSDARRLVSIVRYLNDNAVVLKEVYLLQIDFDNSVIRYAGPDGEREEAIDTVVGAELMTKGFVSEGELSVYFIPTGSGEAFRIMLDDNKSSYVISFNPLSGRATINNMQ